MDLRSDYPYWLLEHGLMKSYPSLNENVSTDVAIIGAGVTGSLVAYHLNKAGFDVTIVDKRHVGTGSTAASTSLLQYEIDTSLVKLKEKVGESAAIESYLVCRQSIYDLEEIIHHLKDETSFKKRNSFQFASTQKHVPALEAEYNARKAAGIKVEWLSDIDIQNKFGFRKGGGILSRDAAEIDAYALTHALLNSCIKKSVRIYDHTKVEEIHHVKRGVELITDSQKKIRAKKLVIACGYEAQQYIRQKVQTLHSTYAIISEPFNNSKFWHRNSLIWETAVPYLYLRTTATNRIVIGGKDEYFRGSKKRDALIPQKTKQLERSFASLFPDIPFKTDFQWAGTFASTKDGLPYIGSVKQHPHTYFALGFGGNGITFSVIAAQMIRDFICRGKRGKNVFGFER
ncbi:FAD-dependent oxidoreductase [Danxiaibacter flavus]|uniref:FAD-dependent oxidoreductase n=1 Tax=Danxiaibacter flavus TaxID=3049108 RepID=A0ABV3ZHJ3_9BACT|nr:FAD-dependent oxidoreductase [Chitinophagaceae bacterium DXS]